MREDTILKGVIKKVLHQCQTFNKEFANVYLYISRKDEAVLYKVVKHNIQEIDTFKYNEFYSFKEGSKLRKIRGFLRYNSFLNYLNEIIHLYKIDILYMRLSYSTKKLMSIMNNKKLIKLLNILHIHMTGK